MMELSDARILAYILYSGAAALIVIGLYAIVVHRHIIRILLGLTVLEAGVNLALVAGGFRINAVAPIMTQTQPAGLAMVDPIPQALVLTAIVIGVGVLALALALAMEVYRAYGTLDTRELAARIALEQTDTAAQANAPVSVSGKKGFPSPVEEAGL